MTGRELVNPSNPGQSEGKVVYKTMTTAKEGEKKFILPSLLSRVFLDGSLDGRWHGTKNLIDLLAVLEEDEGRHGSHAKFLRDVGGRVDVHLVETDIGVLVAVFFDLGGNGFAGTAPGGEAVDEDEAFTG